MLECYTSSSGEAINVPRILSILKFRQKLYDYQAICVHKFPILYMKFHYHFSLQTSPIILPSNHIHQSSHPSQLLTNSSEPHQLLIPILVFLGLNAEPIRLDCSWVTGIESGIQVLNAMRIAETCFLPSSSE